MDNTMKSHEDDASKDPKDNATLENVYCVTQYHEYEATQEQLYSLMPNKLKTTEYAVDSTVMHRTAKKTIW